MIQTTPSETEEELAKQIRTLRAKLCDAKYYRAAKTLDFIMDFHPGYRKDGQTPNVMHQIRMAFAAYNLAPMIEAAGLDVDRLITDILGHDTTEDNKHLQHELARQILGDDALNDVLTLDKTYGDPPPTTDEYYKRVFANPYTFLAKLFDRGDNSATMFALPAPKQPAYDAETTHLVSCAKDGLRRLPELTQLAHVLITGIKTSIDSRLNLLGLAVQHPEKFQAILDAYQDKGITLTTCNNAVRSDSVSLGQARRALAGQAGGVKGGPGG